MNKLLGLLALAAYHATPPERPEPGGQPARITYSEDFAAEKPHQDPHREGAKR